MLARERKQVARALERVERVMEFIASERVAVCVSKTVATTTTDMVRPLDGRVFTEIDKGIGSDLCALYDAARELRAILS